MRGVCDVHLHVHPESMLLPSVRPMMESAQRGLEQVTATPEALLHHLDSEEIDRVCLINYVSPDVMGFTAQVNDWIADFTKAHRQRLLPAGSVNPRFCSDVATETNRILDLGIRLVKVHPPHQRYAANAYLHELPQLAELYRVCSERKVPVMIHTGTSIFPGARNVFADPMAIDDVAIDFPELQIIVAHAGRPLYGETAMFLARRHANVWLDLSGIPPKSLLKYVPRLSELSSKCVWGSDWPSPGVTSMRRNVDEFLQLPLTPEQQQRILRDNFLALFD